MWLASFFAQSCCGKKLYQRFPGAQVFCSFSLTCKLNTLARFSNCFMFLNVSPNLSRYTQMHIMGTIFSLMKMSLMYEHVVPRTVSKCEAIIAAVGLLFYNGFIPQGAPKYKYNVLREIKRRLPKYHFY